MLHPVQIVPAPQPFHSVQSLTTKTTWGNFHVSGILEMSKCKLAPKMGDDPLRHDVSLLVSPRKVPPPATSRENLT